MRTILRKICRFLRTLYHYSTVPTLLEDVTVGNLSWTRGKAE